jgi:serine/threonine protein kinase
MHPLSLLGPPQSDEDPNLPWVLGESGSAHAVVRLVAPVSWNTASAQSAPDVSAHSAAPIQLLENLACHTLAAPEVSRGPSAQSSTEPMANKSPDGSVVDLRHVGNSPAHDDKRPPVICKHSMFSHGLDGAPFQQQFESLMDLVNTSLSTVFPRHMATEARIRVLERMIECLSKRVPRIDVLQSLVHRNCMHSDVIDWFLLSFCQACGIPCACENQQFLDPACVEHDSCPFTIERVPPNLVVWGVSLFEKLRMCNDKDDIRKLLGGKWIGRHLQGREHVAFVDGWKGHYTPGLFHMCANRPAVSWWCSMQWQANAINKLSALALVNVVTGKDPAFHEFMVPKQRINECAPRSLLQVVLNILDIAKGHDPRCLVLPNRSLVNDDSDAFRFCLALNYIKSLGSAGHFDYTDTFRKATSEEPAPAISLVCESSDSDEQDPPADASAGGDPSRASGDIPRGCHHRRPTVLERDKGTSEQSEFDSIVESLQDGRPAATGSAARDHKIRKFPIAAGEDYIAAKDLDHLPLQVRAALQVMRTQCGFDLHCLRGQGSYGVVVEVSLQGERFAVKLGTSAYSDQSTRRDVLVEAALLNFGEQIQKGARNSGAYAIGPFAPRLRLWDGCPAVLINAEGQRFAAVAMQLADSSASKIFDGLRERFRTENCDDPQEDQCLMHDLRSLWKGCLKVVHYMHRAGLAHCDFKPDNMLMKKLDATPPRDSPLVWCKVQGQVYQIWVCDFGHARWSGKGEKATHVFCAHGKKHSNNDIDAVGHEPNSVQGVGLKELQILFGLALRNSQEFRHPGAPTEWIRCPDFDRNFEKGQGDDQRKWDQAADIWALGAMCARLVAAPLFSSRKKVNTMQLWQAHLFKFSRREHDSVQSAIASAWKRQRVANNPSFFGSGRAVQASAAAAASAQSCRSPHQPEPWLEVMVRENYYADPGVALSSRIKGAQGEGWRLLLDFVQKLLSHSSEDRWNFAGGALKHPFFVSPETSAHTAPPGNTAGPIGSGLDGSPRGGG